MLQPFNNNFFSLLISLSHPKSCSWPLLQILTDNCTFQGQVSNFSSLCLVLFPPLSCLLYLLWFTNSSFLPFVLLVPIYQITYPRFSAHCLPCSKIQFFFFCVSLWTVFPHLYHFKSEDRRKCHHFLISCFTICTADKVSLNIWHK